jgi:hypothetical protein
MKFIFFFVRYVPTLVQMWVLSYFSITLNTYSPRISRSILFIGTELTPHFHFTSHDCYIWQGTYRSCSCLSSPPGPLVGFSEFLFLYSVSRCCCIFDHRNGRFYSYTTRCVFFIKQGCILMLFCVQVYALYHTGSAVRIIVGLCFGLEIVGMCVGLGLAIPGIRYNEICLVTAIPETLLVNLWVSFLFRVVLAHLPFPLFPAVAYLFSFRPSSLDSQPTNSLLLCVQDGERSPLLCC